ncbi:10442_t:CDS:2, partial [Gigaspora margarita]
MDLSCIALSEAASIINLTPDEKRGLLFNVNFPLEIPMGDFNDAWWPLVTNIWMQWNSYKSVGGDISKTRPSGLCETKIKVSWLVLSQKEIERIKCSKAIRTLVEQEAVKNYLPLTNIKHKVRGTVKSHLVGNSSLKIDFSNS